MALGAPQEDEVRNRPGERSWRGAGVSGATGPVPAASCLAVPAVPCVKAFSDRGLKHKTVTETHEVLI